MAKGGARQGAGRKKGTVSQKTREKKELAARIASEGITPLEVMGEALRYFHRNAMGGEDVDQKELLMAVAIAEKMAPYVHPKLSAVQVGDKDKGDGQRTTWGLEDDLPPDSV